VNFGSPTESWQHQLRHYAALERSEFAWPGIADYCQLAESIAASRFAERLYALRSLDWLRVSPTSGWVSRGPKWADRPSVLLRPLLGGRVALSLCGGPPEFPAEAECDYGAAWSILEPWLEWLAARPA
jgi:hypothetical protein